MKERPIIFSALMVRAILEGRKTQTRRVVKPVRGFERHNICKPNMAADPWAVWWHGDVTDRVGCLQECPFGKPGDTLWVRENWWKIPEPSLKQLRDGADTWPKVAYNADENDITREQNREMGWRLKPSIHMPRLASRITLEIKDVRVERLIDISESDAQSEGAPDTFSREKCPGFIDDMRYTATFSSLWDAIHGDGAWSLNPWVWVIKFSPVEGRSGTE